MGFHTDSQQRPDNGELADAYYREAAMLTNKMLAALPGNRELINHIRQHGMPKI